MKLNKTIVVSYLALIYFPSMNSHTNHIYNKDKTVLIHFSSSLILPYLTSPYLTLPLYTYTYCTSLLRFYEPAVFLLCTVVIPRSLVWIV